MAARRRPLFQDLRIAGVVVRVGQENLGLFVCRIAAVKRLVVVRLYADSLVVIGVLGYLVNIILAVVVGGNGPFEPVLQVVLVGDGLNKRLGSGHLGFFLCARAVGVVLVLDRRITISPVQGAYLVVLGVAVDYGLEHARAQQHQVGQQNRHAAMIEAQRYDAFGILLFGVSQSGGPLCQGRRKEHNRHKNKQRKEQIPGPHRGQTHEEGPELADILAAAAETIVAYSTIAAGVGISGTCAERAGAGLHGL